MQKEQLIYDQYVYQYWFKPKANDVHPTLVSINNGELNYGIFGKKTLEELDAFYGKTLVCIIYNENRKPVGFYYQYIIDETIPLVHLGLIVIKENKGKDLFYISEKLGTLFLFKNLKSKFYICSITTIPKVLEYIDSVFNEVWPSPSSDLSKPPSHYRKLSETVMSKYIKTFFSSPEKISFNHKRFAIKFDKDSYGFNDDYFVLPKAKKYEYNSFLWSWLNYKDGEDLLIIGRFSCKTYFRLLVYKLFLKIKGMRNV